MVHVAKFTVNPFQENTYMIYDDTKECIIFDPGCASSGERQTLKQHIEKLQLKPVRLINTHCHLDHVFGNRFVAETWNLVLEIHKDELPVLEAVPRVCAKYGLPEPDPSPIPGRFIEDGDIITFGESQLKAILTPGHSPGSLSFLHEESKQLIAGDVLFYESIGRTDLPGGDHATLIKSIKERLLVLDDAVKVYSGHGPATTIGHERKNNPFF